MVKGEVYLQNRKWLCTWPTFGQIDSVGRWVRKTGHRHISTSGLAYRAPGTLFFALFWPVLSPYCTSTVRNAFYKDTGCAKSKSWPGSTIEKPEVHSKMPEVVRNAVKFIFIRKMREKSRCRQTGSSGVLWPTFGQIGIRGRWVRETGRRHISISGLAFTAPGALFFASFWPALSRYRTSTARNAFNKKTGCTKSKSVARKYSSETGSTFKSARNCPKCREIDRNSKNVWKSRRGQTWSGFAKPDVVVYFGLLLDKSKVGVAEPENLVAAIFLIPVWPLEPLGRSFFALVWPVLSPYRT